MNQQEREFVDNFKNFCREKFNSNKTDHGVEICLKNFIQVCSFYADQIDRKAANLEYVLPVGTYEKGVILTAARGINGFLSQIGSHHSVESATL